MTHSDPEGPGGDSGSAGGEAQPPPQQQPQQTGADQLELARAPQDGNDEAETEV